ncbi:MAG: hypothetical protein ACLGQH_05315 [Acidobacteriota bacterium]
MYVLDIVEDDILALADERPGDEAGVYQTEDAAWNAAQQMAQAWAEGGEQTVDEIMARISVREVDF